MGFDSGAGKAGAGIGQGLGGIFGYFMGQGDRENAMKNYQQGTQEFRNLNPNIAAQQATQTQQGPSAYNGLQMGPQTRDNQLAALGQLRQMYQSGGMDPQARAETYQAQQMGNQNAQALNANLQNQMAQRGMGSSGASFAAQRANAQNAANASSMQGMQALAGGQQRAMGALQGSAGLAGQMRGQDYGIASDRAGANDAINRFNAQNSNAMGMFNAGQRQNSMQDSFNNSLGRAQGIQSGLNNEAAQNMNMSGQDMGMAQGAGSALGSLAGFLI